MSKELDETKKAGNAIFTIIIVAVVIYVLINLGQ